LHIEAEDALPHSFATPKASGALRVIAPVFPRISNHTDFDALRLHPQVDFSFIEPDSPIPPCDLIVLPGSKSVRDDLAWLRKRKWDAAITRHLRYGGKVLGICGGFQMLGKAVHDPDGLESVAGSAVGLGLLDVETTLMPEKQLRRVRGELMFERAVVEGYEIHQGISRGAGLAHPLVQMESGSDGAISNDGHVIGTYLHGLFDHPDACASLLRWAGLAGAEAVDYRRHREEQLDRLAQAIETHLDMPRMLQILECGAGR